MDVGEQEKIAHVVVVVDVEACEEFFGVEGGLFGGFVLVGKKEAFGESRQGFGELWVALFGEAFFVDIGSVLVGRESAFVAALREVKVADLIVACGEARVFFAVVFLDELMGAKDHAFGRFPSFEIGVGHAHVAEKIEEEGVAFGDDAIDASEGVFLELKGFVVLLFLHVDVGEVVFDGGDEGVIGALGLGGEVDGALVKVDGAFGLVVFAVGSTEGVEDVSALGVRGIEVAVGGFVGAQEHL